MENILEKEYHFSAGVFEYMILKAISYLWNWNLYFSLHFLFILYSIDKYFELSQVISSRGYEILIFRHIC